MDGLAVPLPAFLCVSHKGWVEKASLRLSAGTRGSGRKVSLLPCHCRLAPFHWSAPSGCSTCSPLKLFVNQMLFAAKYTQHINASKTPNVLQVQIITGCGNSFLDGYQERANLQRSHSEGLEDLWRNRRCCKKWGRVIWIMILPWE